jgi:dolichyl-phosphate beta-glucosyltransferase
MKSVRILPFSAAKGKGNAVRKGVEAANGDYVMFMDADFATDLSALKTALPLLSERCLVVGSRGNKASKVSQRVSPFRNILSWGSRFLIKAMFGLKGISDTQCGWKIADSKTAKSIAKRQRIPGGAFDVEWLWYCKLNGIPYREIPVLWTDQEGSTITHPVRDAARFFRDIVDVRTHKRLYVESEAK